MKFAKAAARAMLSLGAALFSADAPAQRIRIPALENVDQALSDPPRTALEARRAALVSTRALLHGRFKKYEGRCYVRETPQAVRECPGEKVGFDADMDAHIAATKSFNWDLEQAIGEYRIGLERRIRDMDEALKRDADAAKNFGFNRRAEDFDKWVQLSREAQSKAVDKLLSQVFDARADELRSGIFEQVSQANSAQIDQMLLKLRAAGLGAGASAEALRRYQETGDKQLLRPLAMQLSEDLKSLIRLDDALQKSSSFEAAWEALQYFSPPGMRQLLALGETATWATYGAGMQVVAVAEVARLNSLTVEQLRGLHNIHCLFERHTFERYQAKRKLAELTGRGLSELVTPLQSQACAR